MQETIFLILGYLRGIWNYRWVAMVFAWLICLVGWFAVLAMPPQFESTAKVHVDTQTILKPLLKGLAVDLDVRNRVKLMEKTLLSRPNLTKLVRMTDMDLNVTSEEQMEELLDDLTADIKLKGKRKQNIYDLSYTHSDPALAKLVVQSVLTILVESTLGDTRQDTNNAQKFLEEQIENYRKRLIEKEARLKEFKRKNVAYLPGNSDYYQRLQEQKEYLDQAKLDLNETKQRKNELQKQVNKEIAAAKTRLESPDQTEIRTSVDDKIDRLEEKLEVLLLNFTAKHPDVISIQELLAAARKQRKKELVELKKQINTSGVGLVDNVVLQELKLALSQAKADYSVYQTRVKTYQIKVQELQTQVDIVPRIEAEMKDLDRDYGITKESFEVLLERLESVKLSESVERSADTVKFKIVEPPRVPLTPSGPKRILFMVVVLILGLGVGMTMSLLMSQIRSTYDRTEQLVDDLSVPVLGSVAMVWSSGQVLQRRFALISFIVVFGGLLCVFAVILGLLLTGVDLPAIVQRLMGAV
jgi:polysaccharide chain length determinant protein (PEP-CTERM system associated)